MGLFAYNRLTYGVSSAPGIFQTVMESILSGLPKTSCYLDDILIHGTTLNECHENVRKVFSRLSDFNVKVNEQKCKFYQESVEFLGYLITSKVIDPIKEKVCCIENAPSPNNITELKAYLGLYWSRFSMVRRM